MTLEDHDCEANADNCLKDKITGEWLCGEDDLYHAPVQFWEDQYEN